MSNPEQDNKKPKRSFNTGNRNNKGSRRKKEKDDERNQERREEKVWTVEETIGLDLAGGSSKIFDEHAELLAKSKLKKLKTHQIRNFYAGILQVRNEVDTWGMDFWRDKDKLVEKEEQAWFQKLEPLLYRSKVNLAFSTGRQSEVISLKQFYDTLVAKLEGTTWRYRRNALYNFLTLCESVVAYHKFHTANH